MNRARVAAALLAVAALAGCTGDDEPEPSGSASGSSAASGATPEELAERYLTAGEAQPVGSTTGSVESYDGSIAAKADVLALQASARSTVLRWQLTTADGSTAKPRPEAFGDEDGQDNGTRGVFLVTPAPQRQLLKPNTYQLEYAVNCTCSPAPDEIGPRPVELSGVYSPLPAGVGEVEVRIPGLKPVTVPVTRG